MPRISKAPEERKQEIVKIALELFSEKGYDNTTIQDISERMNVAQGLCYRYFKSKQEIFAAASDAYAQQAVESMGKPLRKNAGAVEKFNAVIGNLFAFAYNNSEFEATYHKEMQINAERIQRMGTHISNVIVPIAQQGIEEKVFRCDDVQNTVRLLTFGILNLIHVDMPMENTRQHIQSFIPSIISACKNLLECDDESIGKGWDKF